MKPPEKIPSQRGRPRKNKPQGTKNTPKVLVDATQRALEAPTALGQSVEDTLTRLGVERAFQAPQTAQKPYTDETLALLHEKRMLELTINSELRDQALENFWTFMTEVLYCTPDQRQHYIESFHRPICDMLQNLLKGENLMIVIPRESRKSYILRAFVCWLILRDFNIRVQIVSVTQDKAKKIATTLRQMFMEGTPGMEKLHEVFPECVIRSRRTLLTSQQFVHPMRTINSPDPTVFSTFLGSSSTGSRADLMLVDDGWDNRTLENPEVGVKIFKKFLSLVPLVEGSSLGKYKNIIILATPWKHYDPCSILLGNKIKEVDKEMGAELGRIPFKAYIRHSQEDPDRLCTACPPHVVRMFPHGHPAWDSGKPIMDPIFDKETLEAKRTLAMMDPAQGEEFFMLQYQCVYSFEAGQKFQPAWFVQLEQPTWSYTTQRVICLDDASKDFQTPGIGDFSVCLMGEYGEDGVLLIRYGLRSNRWTRDQFLSEIVSWCRLLDWWPHMAVKEKTSTDAFLIDFQKAFKPFYHRPIILKPIPRGGGKAKNDLIAGSLQTPMERREILFGSQCPRDIMDRARYELVNLGKTLNDDVADALSLFMHPDVRVIPRINRAIELAWTPPDLRSYLPQQDLPPITGLSMHPRTLELGLKVDQVITGPDRVLESMWDMSKSGWGR